jgi:hypothetical protein
VGDRLGDQAARLAFHGERQRGGGIDAHHDSLEPSRDVRDGPLQSFEARGRVRRATWFVYQCTSMCI